MRQAALAVTMGSAPMHALIDRLPAVRGGYRADVPLARYTWLRVGGAAEVLFEPADRDDLAHFIADKPTDVPVTVIGVASNLLVRDGGIPGVTIRHKARGNGRERDWRLGLLGCRGHRWHGPLRPGE